MKMSAASESLEHCCDHHEIRWEPILSEILDVLVGMGELGESVVDENHRQSPTQAEQPQRFQLIEKFHPISGANSAFYRRWLVPRMM